MYQRHFASPLHIANLIRRTYSVLLIAIAIAAYSDQVIAQDLFIGKFASETRNNFGTEKFGDIEINIDRKDENYIITVFHQGKFKFDFLTEPCSPKETGYLQDRPAGNISTLCNLTTGSVAFIYSQNGIKNPMLRIYKQQGIEKPLNSSEYYRAQYYAGIQWGSYGFRKVNAFQFAPNDPIIISKRETPEFIALCKTAGVQFMEKTKATVDSIAYDGLVPIYRIDLDSDGRINGIGGFSKPNSEESHKKNKFKFTERRSGSSESGRATINPSAPYYHFPADTTNPYYGVENLSADVLLKIDVDKPDELRKAPINQGAIRYQITLSDRRSGAILGVQTFVVDRINNRACGANVDNNISLDAFIYDAINR